MKKSSILINTFSIFFLCFISHFVYEKFPNNLFAIFFPVNESIWEHMKMLFTTIMIYGIVEFFLNKRNLPNFFTSLFFKGLSSISIYLIIFLPFYVFFGHSMLFTISLLFIVILLVEIISYYIKQMENIKILNYISAILIIISFVAFGYLTYHPIKNFIFLDTEKNKYGIHTYTSSFK